jgi:hypothetical protein
MIQPDVGRLEFASDLRMVRASLVTMTETASKAIRAATTALLDLDLEAVRMTGIAGARTRGRPAGNRAPHAPPPGLPAAGGG